MAALCRKIKAPLQVLEVEVKVYEAGMLLARHLGLQDRLLQGDSLTISNALEGILVPLTSVATIVEGIRALGFEIDVVNFSHVRRPGNRPIHILARQALSFVNDVIWIEEIPQCIQQGLIQDVIVCDVLLIIVCSVLLYQKKKNRKKEFGHSKCLNG